MALVEQIDLTIDVPEQLSQLSIELIDINLMDSSPGLTAQQDVGDLSQYALDAATPGGYLELRIPLSLANGEWPVFNAMVIRVENEQVTGAESTLHNHVFDSRQQAQSLCLDSRSQCKLALSI